PGAASYGRTCVLARSCPFNSMDPVSAIVGVIAVRADADGRRAQRRHLNRGRPHRGRAITQLAVAVAAPDPHRTVALERDRVRRPPRRPDRRTRRRRRSRRTIRTRSTPAPTSWTNPSDLIATRPREATTLEHPDQAPELVAQKNVEYPSAPRLIAWTVRKTS